MAGIRKVDLEKVRRQWHAGYSAQEIAKSCGVTRQCIYLTVKGIPKLKALITSTNNGFLITPEDAPAAATAIRNALRNRGWEVEG